MKLSLAYKSFIDDKLYVGLSKDTHRNYDYFINELFIVRYIGPDVDSHKLTADDFKSYVINLRNKEDFKSRSVKTYASHVRIFLNYLYNNKYIDFDPIRECKLPKYHKSIKEIYDDEELYLIFKAIKKTYKSDSYTYKKLMFLYALMINTGARAGEILSLNVKDFNYEKGYVKLHGSKTYQDRLVPICRATRKLYLNYIDVRYEPVNDTAANRDALFVSDKLKRMTQDSLRRYCYTYIKGKAGIERGNNHLFRHTFATRSIYHGMPLFELQEILGHSQDANTTRNYVRLVSQMRIAGAEYDTISNILMNVL